MVIYIVFFSCVNGGDTLCREVKGVYFSRQDAVQAVLWDIEDLFEYDMGPKNGKEILCDNDAVILSVKASSHNGGVLELSVPDNGFRHVRFSDDEDCPEWVREWDIEESAVFGRMPEKNDD